MICDEVLSGEAEAASLNLKYILRINGYICVSRVGGWIRMILEEAHYLRYSTHP